MRNHKQYERQTYNMPPKGGETTGNESSKGHDNHEPVQAEHLEVKVYNNFDKALKAFRTLVQKERVLSSYKEKQTFEKPSDKKRRKKAEAIRNQFELENKKEYSFDSKKNKWNFNEQE